MSNHSTHRFRTPVSFVIGLVCVVALAAACSSGSDSKASTSSSSTAGSASSSAPASAGTEVTIKDFKFGPETQSVKVGAKVKFQNSDTQPHTATSDTGGAFDAGAIDPSGSKEITFDTAGTFAYHCSFHPFMRGTIEVK